MDALLASTRRVSPWIPWLAVAATLAIAWACTHPQPLDVFTSEAAVGSSILMLYLAVMWGRWRALVRAAIVALLGVVGWVGGRLSAGWIPSVPDTIGAGGVALVPFLFYRAWQRDDDDARMDGLVARLATAYLLLAPTVIIVAGSTVDLLPNAWDAPALAIDSAFPIHAFHVGRWLERWPSMRMPAHLAYDWIFRLVPALVALRLRLVRPQATDFLVVCIVVCFLGQLGYYVTPIVGPGFAFARGFPDRIPDLTRLPMTALPVPSFLRNGMPSLHMAWALVLVWSTRPFAWPLRALGALVVVLTIVATLGFGEHYVIDLVAAVPYAVVAQTIGTLVPHSKRSGRLALLLVCSALTLAWVVAPHVAWRVAGKAPLAIVVAAALTVAIALAGERWLRYAAASPERDS